MKNEIKMTIKAFEGDKDTQVELSKASKSKIKKTLAKHNTAKVVVTPTFPN